MARCASCSYPLTIIDSIECYECSSHFHIDCAQLVGFPYYELSGDPSRNTFHCSTCKILPLPRRRSESDSDTEDSAMPSRQLDYQQEGEADLAKTLHEVQGNVHDLSDLCKDMLREINELKSTNLTLRCCVENLRHDNEKRDCEISELKYRLDGLERNRRSNRSKDEGFDWEENREGENERYLTPEPGCLRDEELNLSFSKSYSGIIPDYRIQNVEKDDEFLKLYEQTYRGNDEDFGESKIDSGTTKVDSSNKSSENYNQEPEIEPSESLESEETINFDESRENQAEELTDTLQRRQDWEWKGSEAVKVENPQIDQSEEEDDEEESETSQKAEGETHEWEVLEAEIQSKSISTLQEKSTDLLQDIVSSKPDKGGETEKESWEKKHEGFYTEQHSYDISRPAIDNENEQNTSLFEIESAYHPKGEEVEDVLRDQETPLPEEALEEGAEEKEEVEGQLPVADEGDGETIPEELQDGIIVKTDQEGELRLDGEEDVVLEGEGVLLPTSEGELGVEGEQLGEQSPVEGEAQPTEPQPPPPPEHTEEDLWLYLKETVTSVHPATVEEFVQNLIGTLQHVPEEYLKPVIDANIKRATSPCALDNELPVIQEGIPPAEGEEAPPDDSVPVESAEGDSSVPEVAEEGSAPSAVPDESALPEEAADGFSGVEGALIGGFWLVWLFYTIANTRGV